MKTWLAVWAWLYRALIAVLSFFNFLEDEAAGKARRLSLTNVAFWSALLLGAAVIIKSVLMPPTIAEYAMVGVVSLIAAFLRETKNRRRSDDDD